MWFAAAVTYGLIGWIGPWWVMVPLISIWGAFESSYRRAAVMGFLAVFSAWFGLIVGWDYRGLGVASNRLSGLLGINNIYLFIVMVCAVAGAIGAVSAMSGRWIRNLISE
jgi:hypothetical protein